MKITFPQAKPEGFTQIRLIQGPITRFIELNTSTTLGGKGQELHIGMGNGEQGEALLKKPKAFNQRKMILVLRKIVATAKQYRLKNISLDWKELRSTAEKTISDKKLGEIAAVAFGMADFDFNVYKQEPPEGFTLVEEISLIGAPKLARDGALRGEIIYTEVNSCRALSNTPGGDLTPKKMAETARTIAKGTKVNVEVLGQKEMEKLGMGAILGIAKGSSEEPRFIVMEYWGKGRPSTRLARSGQLKPVVLVGKGVTFDTGGLQTKPGDAMYEMHMDMSGGAAVMHAIVLASKLGLKTNIITIIPSVENSPSGSAVRPGDILRSLSGKTIEILHTDAEGRVIFADAITYAKKYDPKIVVDVATLTGAALIALGTQASAFMTNKESLISVIEELGEESGDYVWPFPAWEEYEEMTKGTFGDIPNISTAGNSRWGGVIAGGMFLREFAKDLPCPWVHIDMAPRMTSTQSEFLAKGAVGAPVRLLLGIIEEYGR